MIKAVVFDLDGMVFKNRRYFSIEITEKLNIPKGKVLEFFTTELKDCQKGKLDMKEVMEKTYFPIWGWTKSFEEFTQWWFNGETLNARVVELVGELKKQGIVCVLLTNNEKYRLNFLIDEFNLNDIFDHIILPFEVGAIKPEKEIFQAVLEKTGLKAGEVVVCDDQADRLTGAQELGFHVLVPQNEETLEKGLADLRKK